MKKLFVLIALLTLNIFQANAKSDDEVTLVVSADGSTKEEATKAALRSAIEQAYGAFVSANTTILNDELVKDEIVTISNGNIKEFSELSCNGLQDGRLFVTLKATVSLSKLTQYAQNKGAETEFAGAAFGMDVKMKKVNKENELIVFKHMEEKLSSINHLFDYSIELKEPRVATRRDYHPREFNPGTYIVEGVIHLFYNSNTDLFNEILYNTVQAVEVTNVSREEKEDYEKMGLALNREQSPAGNWISLRNRYPRTEVPNTIVTDTGKRLYWWTQTDYLNELDRSHKNRKESPVVIYTNRNEYGHELPRNYPCWEWYYFAKSAFDFVISDNISSPTSLSVLCGEFEFDRNLYAFEASNKENEWTGKVKLKIKKITKIGDEVGRISIRIIIPKEDISKYSKFSIK